MPTINRRPLTEEEKLNLKIRDLNTDEYIDNPEYGLYNTETGELVTPEFMLNERYTYNGKEYLKPLEVTNHSAPSLQIFDNGYYSNPNVRRFHTKLDTWKHKHPWQNFAYDAFAASPVILPAALSFVGSIPAIGAAAISAPLTTIASFATGYGGAVLGSKLFDKGIMQKFTPYNSVGEYVYDLFGYPYFVGDMLNPGGASGATVSAVIPIGIRNLISNGGINTLKTIYNYKPTIPKTPKIPEGWHKTYRDMNLYNPELLVKPTIYSDIPVPSSKLRFNITNKEFYYPVKDDFARSVTYLDNFTDILPLSTYDLNVTFIPHKDFLETHFGTASEGGSYINYQGNVGKAGHPSDVGKLKGIKGIALQESNTYFGPDSEAYSWMRRLDTGISTKSKEFIKMFTERFNPQKRGLLSADGWKINSKSTKYSTLTVSDTHYISFDDMLEETKYIELDKFGEKLIQLGKNAIKSKNLKELNNFLKSQNLPLAYFENGELRFPEIINKTK